MPATTQKTNAARTPVRRAENATKKRTAPAARDATQTTARPPAYMQAKLAVSHPQDSAEQEADKVARQIARAPRPVPAPAETIREKQASRASLEPAITPEHVDTLALKPAPSAESIQRQTEPADATAQPTADDDAAVVDSSLESRIDARRGGGNPLPATVAADMARRFNRDFGDVRIHNDSAAADLCAEVNARAFTVGNDVFFAPGEFAPDTDSGKELLAHELTHVVQQNGAALRRLQRCPNGDAAGASANCFSVNSGDYAGTSICLDSGSRCMSLPRLRLPALKRRNSSLFPQPLPVRQTARPHTDQTNKFRTAVNNDVTAKLNDLTDRARTAGAVESAAGAGEETYFFTLTNNRRFMLFGNSSTLLPRLQIPFWDPRGRPTNFQVDHIREMQLNGEDVETNYELLEGGANMGAGRAIAKEIRDTIKGGLEALKTAHPTAAIPAASRWGNVKRSYQVSFRTCSWNLPHDDSANGGRFWSLQDIRDGDHIALLRPMTVNERSAVGSSGAPAIYPSAQGGIPLPAVTRPRRNWITRVDLVRWTPTTAPDDPNLGTLQIDAYKGGNAVATSPDYPSQSWLVKRIPGMNAGYVDPASYTVGLRNSLRLPGMSPIELDEVTLSADGLAGAGRVLPTVPLIGAADIRIRIRGNEAQIYKTFAMEELPLPAPFRMDSCDLTVFYSTTRGLGIDGRADFGVERLGEGFLGAAASTRGGFALEGGFDFDSQLFDRAHIEMWYRNDQFGALGDIGIDSPDKVRGIRSASLHMAYEAGQFNATGTVEPDIPGVQAASLRVAYAEESGLTIGGTLQLTQNPAIRSGSVDVTVRKVGEQWKVAASGTAQPALPGINSQLTVSYDDGAFTAEFSGAYARGMLAGRATVGITNRSVGEGGEPSGPAVAGAPLLVYGNGSATVQIAPWLQGTAGIRFAPNGEVTVTGEIGLPNQLEIFSLKELNKPIFRMSTQIPIVPGIVAEVGGNLSAHASIGPGALDQLRIGIEYNPAHEENTHITGDAHLNIPAEAGVRLGARAGIGLGITGASATGGLEVGGTLGIGGAAEAGVHIDWMPSTGLAIDAEGYLHAEPKFKFDVSGYVAVTALGFSVYDNSWELAAYELGSNLRFGVRFPIHYREGEPFDVSLDDVEFEVPDIDPAAMVRQLGDRIF